jgi:hypothetical protein
MDMDPPELGSLSCVGLTAILGFRDFVFLCHVLCFYNRGGALAFRVTHGTTAKPLRCDGVFVRTIIEEVAAPQDKRAASSQ